LVRGIRLRHHPSSIDSSIAVSEIDPKQATNFLLSDILTALSFGLAFVAAPEVAVGVEGIQAATAAAGEALITGLQNTPAVGKAIWSTGTIDSQSIQIGGWRASSTM